MQKIAVVIGTAVVASIVAIAPAFATASAAKGVTATKYAKAKASAHATYVYGGIGPSHFDCSGLTYASWKSAGVSIPRVANDQLHRLHSVKTMPKGKALNFSGVRPGDILAFGTSTSYSSHVALYIGAGMMVVAHKPGTRLAEIHVSTDVGSKNSASQHVVRVVRP